MKSKEKSDYISTCCCENVMIQKSCESCLESGSGGLVIFDEQNLCGVENLFFRDYVGSV